MYSLLPGAVAVLFLGYGLYVLKQSGRPRASLSFFLLCLTTFAWQFTWAVLFQVEDVAIANVLVRVGYFFILFLPTSLYHFLVEISEQRRELVRVKASYGFAALLAVSLPSDLFVSGAYEYFFGLYPKAGVLHPLHVVQTCIVVSRGLYITWRAQQVAPPRARIRLRYCVASLLIYLFAAVDYLCNYGLEFYPPGVFIITISLGLLGIATVKHQLMDVSVALTEGLARVLTVGLFALAWTAGYLGLSLFDHRNVHIELGVGLAFIVLVGEGYAPFRRFFHNRLMGQPQHRVDRTLVMQAVTDAVANHVSLRDMMHAMESALVTYSGLRSLRLFLRGDVSARAVRGPKGEFLLWDSQEGMVNYSKRISERHSLIQHLSGEASIVHLRELNGEAADILRAWHARSAVAIKVNDKLVGVMLVGILEGVDHYTHHELDLIDFLPSQLKLGFDRVQAYGQLCHSLERAQKSASLMALMNEYQHELKAPISIMHMFCQSRISTDVLREEVRRQCDRALDLLDKMLRVLQDNRAREDRPVDINAVILSSLRLFPASGLRVEVDLDPHLPRFQGDADDLLILCINLLKNAREATDELRENCVTLRTRHFSERGAIHILVEDTGKGMNSEQIKKLWLPASSEKPGGSGLGLKVMQRIVREHGGTITATSEEGKGTSFDIRLPLETEMKQQEAVHG